MTEKMSTEERIKGLMDKLSEEYPNELSISRSKSRITIDATWYIDIEEEQ